MEKIQDTHNLIHLSYEAFVLKAAKAFVELSNYGYIYTQDDGLCISFPAEGCGAPDTLYVTWEDLFGFSWPNLPVSLAKTPSREREEALVDLISEVISNVQLLSREKGISDAYDDIVQRIQSYKVKYLEEQ